MRLKITLLIILFLFSNLTWTATSAKKLWSYYTLSGNYDSFVYYVEPQLRFIGNNKPFNQFLNNFGGGYQINSDWSAWLGQTIGTTSQDAAQGDFEEYRIWQQLLWNHRFKKIQAISRTRLEERYSLDFPTWAKRVRERLTLITPLSENISFVTSNEILVNLNRVSWILTKTIDQNRAYFGIQQQLSKSTALGVGYMNQLVFESITQSNNVLVIYMQTNLPA